jgi:dishevelled associated activator of morphogenesis
VIDSRRATNLEILLAKLKKNKLTNESLAGIILNMDTKEELNKDTIEQLLKFVPTESEETLLNENSSEYINMAEPDRFLFDMSRIFHYKQKLEALYFKKKYTERFKELKTKVSQATKCCNILLEDKNIVTLLNIVLCMGNFMNQGHRNGTAAGFSISNLNKLTDIKSSIDKSYSMLHYLIDTIEKRVKSVTIFKNLKSKLFIEKF